MEGYHSSALGTPGPCAFLPMEWNQVPKIEIGSPPKISICTRVSSSQNLLGPIARPALSGLGLLRSVSHLPPTTGALCFHSSGKELLSLLGVNGQNWDSTSKIASIQGLQQDKSSQERQVWLSCPLVIFLDYEKIVFICQHLGEGQ